MQGVFVKSCKEDFHKRRIASLRAHEIFYAVQAVRLQKSLSRALRFIRF